MKMRDWTAVKKEYVTGWENLKILSENHGIPLRTIEERSRNENWVEERKKFRSETLHRPKGAETEPLVRLQAVAQEMADLIANDIVKLKRKHQERQYLVESDIKMIKELTVALKRTADIMRDIHAIPTIREQLLLEQYKDCKKSSKADHKEGGVILLPMIHEEDKNVGD